MTILINKGEIGDARQMTALDASCFSNEIRYSQQMFEELLARNSVYTIVARNELTPKKIMAGFAMMEQVKGRANYGHLITIDIHPNFRRMGIGSKLLDRLHGRVKKRGLEKMILEVYANNTQARNFYDVHGYQAITTLSDYYGIGQDGLLMIKIIQ